MRDARFVQPCRLGRGRLERLGVTRRTEDHASCGIVELEHVIRRLPGPHVQRLAEEAQELGQRLELEQRVLAGGEGDEGQ